MDSNRSEEAKVLGQMMELFRSFTRVNPINDDGQTILVTYWINADAERQYNLLKQRYVELQKQKEE